MLRVRFVACFAVVAAALIAIEAPPARAGVTTVTDPAGDVTAGGLTSAERAAIDIVSGIVSGEEDLGVLVTVQFAGNFTKRIGLGHLKKAKAELLLLPTSPDAAPASLTTKGPGPIGETVRNTSSEEAGVVRDGSSLTFFIFGPGFSNVDSVEVNVFARPPQASARRQPAGAADTTGPVQPPKADLTCEELVKELDEVSKDVDKARADLKRAEKGIKELKDAIQDELREIHGVIHEFGSNSKEYQQARERFHNALAKLKKGLRNLRGQVETLEIIIEALEGARREIIEQLKKCTAPGGKTLGAVFDWDFQGEVEVRGTGSFSEEAGRATTVRTHGETADIDAVKVVIPPDGSTGRQITNQLCPSQLPNASLSTTTYANDTLTCSGGTLAVGEQFTLNVRTSPPPTAGMGGELYGSREGSFQGPFTITGP
ncbi:MAG: hypothetical protein ACRDHM_04500 [Actinomycetota bacterium]